MFYKILCLSKRSQILSPAYRVLSAFFNTSLRSASFLPSQIGKLRRVSCSSLISAWVSSWTRCRRPWSCSCWLPSRGTFPRQLGKWAPILFLFYSCLLNRSRCQWKNGIKNQLSCSFCFSFECWKKAYSRCYVRKKTLSSKESCFESINVFRQSIREFNSQSSIGKEHSNECNFDEQCYFPFMFR